MAYAAMSFHLAEALNSLIYTTGASIYQRTNLLALIYSDVEAMLSWKDNERDALNNISQRIEMLRDSYEPILDESEDVVFKRIAFEKKLDITRTELIKIINRNDLVSESMLKEVQTQRWN